MPRCGMLGQHQSFIAVHRRHLFSISTSINRKVSFSAFQFNGESNGYKGRSISTTGKRIDCDVPAQILERDTQRFLPATICNYSKCGMYLVSDSRPIIGSGIAILLVNYSPQSPEPNDTLLYHSQVIWHTELSRRGIHARYGFGVKHCQNLEEFLQLF